jgi:Ca-activated chloride channel family protein
MDGELDFDIPNLSENTFRIPVSLIMDATDHHTAKPPPPSIVKAMSKLTLFRMQEQAKKSLDDGDVDAASEKLKNLATHLFSKGNKNLAKTVLLEAEQVRKSKNMSQEGQKTIKYGTRSLLKTNSLFEDE